MKYFYQLIFIFFVFISFSVNVQARCDFPIYESDNLELDIPCMDIGIGTCAHIVFEYDYLKSDNNKVIFSLKDAKNTHKKLPAGDDAVFNSIYDAKNEILKVPYVMIDDTLNTYNVSLKINKNNNFDYYKWSFEVVAVEKAEIPNICEEQNIKSCRTIDNGQLIYCVEYTGDANFVNAMNCGNTKSSYTACPGGAVKSCQQKLYGDNFMIEYAYVPEAITPTMLNCNGDLY